MPEPEDSVTVTYRTGQGPPRRVRYQPVAGGGHERIVEEHTGCRWRPVGREDVELIDVETGAELLP
ncbi:hypothetical protein VB779_08735 [Haloarculaceae archaeon H-GB11]|nr:hypothetical protein [Haloarculaceae archaeon H-GB11]